MATALGDLPRSPSYADHRGVCRPRHSPAAVLPWRPLVGDVAECFRVGRAFLYRDDQPAGVPVSLLAMRRAFPLATGRVDGSGAARGVSVSCALRSRSPTLQSVDGDDPACQFGALVGYA